MTESADVTLDDLNEEQLQVVEVIGLEAYKRLIHYYAGTSIYIPKFSEIERRKRNEKIRIEYEKNGDIKALALKYGLSEIQIRTIIGDLFKNKKSIHTKDKSHCLIYRKFKESSKV